jgi:acetylornithine deacetylase
MGRPIQGPEFLEGKLTDYLQSQFESLGVDWHRQPVEPGRDNIFAYVPGEPPEEQGGELLMWEAHQDTVPVDGMTVAAFQPEFRGGRLYGRGACDVKGGMAAMLCAVARLARERPARRTSVVLACTVNEEFGFTGASAVEDLWSDGAPWLPRPPDAAIVAEPTQLDVVVAHKGVVRWRCHARGRAAHTAQLHLGDNAIYKMGRVILAVEQYQQEVIPRMARHPRLGAASVCVSTIHGGISVNTVPDRATIEIDRRLLPDENPYGACEELAAYVAQRAGDAQAIQHDAPFLHSPALSDERNGALAERVAAVARQSCGRCEPVGVPYGTDAAVFASFGIPSVVFGPGSIDQAHTADEWIELEQVEQAAEIYFRLASMSI